jgi:hypothetical protein
MRSAGYKIPNSLNSIPSVCRSAGDAAVFALLGTVPRFIFTEAGFSWWYSAVMMMECRLLYLVD